MNQKITILGPNLRDQSKGEFHVHDASCQDLGKYRGEETYTAEFEDIEDVVTFIYGDIIAENDGDEVWGNWEAYIVDFHFLPCVKLART